MVTNTDRAAWADAALGDLLCDLLHLAQAEGLDPLALMERALWHYEYEILHPDA